MNSKSNDISDGKVFAGVRWSAFSKYGSQLTRFLTMIVLARLIAPEYFGVFALAQFFIGLSTQLRNLGFQSAIIQRKDLDPKVVSSVFYVQLGLSIAVGAVLAGASSYFGAMYEEPELRWVLMALCLTFLFSGFETIPATLLAKEMKFESLAVREVISAFVSGAVSIGLALCGLKLWALVIGSLAGDLWRALSVNWVCRWKPSWHFSWHDLKGILSFGINVTGFRLINYASRNGDKLIIGAMIGAGPLGIYAFAHRLMILPRDTVNRVVGRVLFPAFAKLQDDDDRFARAYLRAIAMIGFLTIPMMLTLAIVSEPFVKTAAGDNWLDAIPIIALLAPVGILQALGGPTTSVHLAKDRANTMFRFSLVAGTLRISAFLIGAQFGLVMVAALYACAATMIFIIQIFMIRALMPQVGLRRLYKTMEVYLIGGALSGALALLLRAGLHYLETPQAIQLVSIVAVSCVTYGLFCLLVQAPALLDAVKVMPNGMIRRRIEKRIKRIDPAEKGI